MNRAPIPGLSADLFPRATALATKARAARQAMPTAPNATIRPAEIHDGVATLRLYDYIDGEGGYWGISADEFAEALDQTRGVDAVTLRINSGGGAVWDGFAILNLLRSWPARVTAVVDGVAASAASFIAVGCDEVVMMPNSQMMIHDALGICVGQAADMLEYAAFLEDASTNVAAVYAAKTGEPIEDWRATMADKGLMGTWYTAEQAVEVGLADRVGEVATPPAENKITASMTADDLAAASLSGDTSIANPSDETPAFHDNPRVARFMDRRNATHAA